MITLLLVDDDGHASILRGWRGGYIVRLNATKGTAIDLVSVRLGTRRLYSVSNTPSLAGKEHGVAAVVRNVKDPVLAQLVRAA